jgi:metallo-beta-lactamase class B
MYICIYNLLSVEYEKYKISTNLEIIQLSSEAYIHISYSDSQWGRIASNGFIYLNESKAFLFDTPMDEATTIELVKYISDSLKSSIVGFVPNHWHADCMGGIEYLHSIGVQSYANKMTRDLAIKNNYPSPKNIFSDSTTLKFGKQQIFCYYPGAAHSMDNIVVWIPSEKILFAGCMAKDLKASNMGNYADGSLKTWPVTIKNVMNRFPDVAIVIPGHGNFGGFELLKHTYELALKFSEN